MRDDGNKYKQDGVNISVGDAFSKFCADINQGTHHLSHYVEVFDLSQGNFRGPRGFQFVNLPAGCIVTGGMDGIGTKVVIIVASGSLLTAAHDVIAMTAMDITRWGGLPLVFMNIFDVKSLGDMNSKTFELCQQVMAGLKQIAHRYGYVLFNGETAELGVCVGSENPGASLAFNWGGAMIGVYHPNKMILGNTLRPGQVIVALQDGFRSNGISSVRKALAMRHGEKWWDNPEAIDHVRACAAPSILYDRMLNKAHGWFDQNFEAIYNMHLIVHLSGGAFESKLGSDILAHLGLSAELNDLFDPPDIMQLCADWRGMQPAECYQTWNGGQGAIVVLDPDQAEDFVIFSNHHNIPAKIAGRITEKQDYTVAIKSKFGKQEMLYY